MSIRCPNCGTVFETDHESDLHYMQSHVFLNGKPVTGVTSDTLTIQENETMPTINRTERTTSNNTNGTSTMENISTIDMNAFADLVAQRVKANTASASRAKQTVDGGNFALTSKYYGKEICGQMYSPFLVPRFLEKQYKEMMEGYENMNDAVRAEVSYMESIYFMIDECHRLSYMDSIAFDERRKFWSVKDVQNIFIGYFTNLKDCIDKEKDDVIERIHEKNRKVTYFKFRNMKYPAHIGFVNGKRKNGSVFSKATLVVEWKYDKLIEDSIARLKTCMTYGDLYKYMSLVRNDLVKLDSLYTKKYLGNGKFTSKYNDKGYLLDPMFVEGYKKKGAFYTLCNMIRFSHANVYEYESNRGSSPRVLSGRDAIDYVRSKLDSYQAYQYHAMLKRTMNITH